MMAVFELLHVPGRSLPELVDDHMEKRTISTEAHLRCLWPLVETYGGLKPGLKPCLIYFVSFECSRPHAVNIGILFSAKVSEFDNSSQSEDAPEWWLILE